MIKAERKKKGRRKEKRVKQRTNNKRQKTNVVTELEAIRESQNLEKIGKGIVNKKRQYKLTKLVSKNSGKTQ